MIAVSIYFDVIVCATVNFRATKVGNNLTVVSILLYSLIILQ